MSVLLRIVGWSGLSDMFLRAIDSVSIDSGTCNDPLTSYSSNVSPPWPMSSASLDTVSDSTGSTWSAGNPGTRTHGIVTSCGGAGGRGINLINIANMLAFVVKV